MPATSSGQSIVPWVTPPSPKWLAARSPKTTAMWPRRQAIVVFSDGADRYSAHTAAEVMERARRSTALIYPIAFGKSRAPLLAELAVLTGGRSFLLRDARELEKTLATIARELRYQYLIGYTPERPIQRGEREWRSIRVMLKGQRRDVRIRARDGYMTE